MSNNSSSIKDVALGAATGLRSSYGIFGVVAQTPASKGALGSNVAKGIAAVQVVGETVLDKLPATPDRLKGPGLVFRGVFGSGSAVARAHRDGDDLRAAAIVGLAGSAATTFGGSQYRSYVKKSGWTDFPFAAVEDLLAAVLAWWGGRPARLVIDE